MKDFKRLKDPIYGYIDIPSNYMVDIVDTSSFQRLRRIIQTSYSPLYSSAVHNRFVHSLGVYHLGEIALNTLEYEIKNNEHVINTDLNVDKTGKLFLLACMLHDVGHAPFSHTGEEFYLDSNKEYGLLHERLIQIVNSDNFSKDVPSVKSSAAAPHEIMSIIIALKEYAQFFDDADDREFFARCISGYRYSEESKKNGLKNCFISLLNSKVIDVDKMDYLIRDAFITGFDTVNIDYERLLTSLTIIKKDGKIELSYYKSAISVIENVVYAHDSERKWIQSHPIVLYESYILQHIISHLGIQMNTEDKKLFSEESLGKEGQDFGVNLHIKLMCDDDIVFLMKNVYSNELCEEFFERRKRRHPIWKSEAEYKAFFLRLTGEGELLAKFEKAMESTAKYLTKSSDSWVINDNLITKIEKELSDLDTIILDETTKKVQKKDKTDILKIMKCLKKYTNEIGKKCDFVILMASQFNSGFSKPDFSATNIVFPTKDGNKVAEFGEIASSLNAKSKDRDSFFYLFYNREEDEQVNIDKTEICRRLFLEFL